MQNRYDCNWMTGPATLTWAIYMSTNNCQNEDLFLNKIPFSMYLSCARSGKSKDTWDRVRKRHMKRYLNIIFCMLVWWYIQGLYKLDHLYKRNFSAWLGLSAWWTEQRDDHRKGCCCYIPHPTFKGLWNRHPIAIVYFKY